MKVVTLAELFDVFPQTRWREADPRATVSSLCFDSRQLRAGCVFVAIPGSKVDGHTFLTQAAAQGALGLVVEDESKIPAEFRGASIKVASSRDALNQLASRLYAEPARELFAIGVTGTNGKTTTTHMIEAIFTQQNRATGVIGTIDHHLGAKVWPTELTTPDALSFQQRLREFVDLGAHAVALEVSSIGLLQNRVDQVDFDVAIFTNLSRDHLDYHKDMEDYFQAKRKLFTELLVRSRKAHPTAVINGDDEYGRRLEKDCRENPRLRTWTVGEAGHADLNFKTLKQGFFGTAFELITPVGMHTFKIQMPGLHNVYNAVGAIGAAIAAGVPLVTCAAALSQLTGVKGRLESVPNEKGLYIFVDYAHTDGAIETVLHYLGVIRRSAGLTNRIITVFGCGGDRDKGKRPLMMKAAAQGSDFVVVTSDNPRSEDPQAIVNDALAGADPKAIDRTIFPVVDRRQGIRRAIELAQAGDVILIAGKGHEDYQQIGNVKHAFSDVTVVGEILQ